MRWRWLAPRALARLWRDPPKDAPVELENESTLDRAERGKENGRRGKRQTITNPDKATGHDGHTVTVTGKTNEDAKTITIDTVIMAQ